MAIPREDLSVVASDHQTEGAIADRSGRQPGIGDGGFARGGASRASLAVRSLAAIALGMPGTGAIVAAGPLAAELGEAAGHVAGQLPSTLMKAGLSDEECDGLAAADSCRRGAAWRARARDAAGRRSRRRSSATAPSGSSSTAVGRRLTSGLGSRAGAQAQG